MNWENIAGGTILHIARNALDRCLDSSPGVKDFLAKNLGQYVKSISIDDNHIIVSGTYGLMIPQLVFDQAIFPGIVLTFNDNAPERLRGKQAVVDRISFDDRVVLKGYDGEYFSLDYFFPIDESVSDKSQNETQTDHQIGIPEKVMGISGSWIYLDQTCRELDGLKVGQKLRWNGYSSLRNELRQAKEILVVGFTSDRMVVTTFDGKNATRSSVFDKLHHFDIITEAKPAQKREDIEIPEKVMGISGSWIYLDQHRRELDGFKAGQRLRWNGNPDFSHELREAEEILVVGFTSDNLVVITYDGKNATTSIPYKMNLYFDIIPDEEPERKQEDIEIPEKVLAINRDYIHLDQTCRELDGLKVGQKLRWNGHSDLRFELRQAKEILVVGFTSDGMAVTTFDGKNATRSSVFDKLRHFDIIPDEVPERKQEDIEIPEKVMGFSGSYIYLDQGIREYQEYKVGQQLQFVDRSVIHPEISQAKKIIVVGFTLDKRVVMTFDGQNATADYIFAMRKTFRIVQ